MYSEASCSIHPQGWVPIETISPTVNRRAIGLVAFTPKGGCPLKLHENAAYLVSDRNE